jgi:hypothetical protein
MQRNKRKWRRKNNKGDIWLVVERRKRDGRGNNMSFKTVQSKIARREGVSMDRAGAMLAAGTRRAMTKHGVSTKHGIPKDVFHKGAFKYGGKNIKRYTAE